MKILSVLLMLTSNMYASEANLKIPDLRQVTFGSIDGHTLLVWGILICIIGMAFGLYHFSKVSKLPVHRAMLEVSELIYETCKTYLLTQGKFLFILWVFIAVIILFYFGYLLHFSATQLFIILLFSIIGILGSYSVAWFGMRMNTYANSRTAFAVLKGYPYPAMDIPLRAGISIGTLLVSIELIIMLVILLFVPGEYSGPCFIGFAIGESLGAAALRIAGGIFTKIADIGSDLMKIVFKIKEDDARNPGVIADCTGDNAGDSVGPTADGFETYGVTGVALITFIVLAVKDIDIQVKLLVWIFMMRIGMILTSIISYWLNGAYFKSKYEMAKKLNFELPLTALVWLTSIVSIIMTYIFSYILIPDLNGDTTLWYKLATIITCGTLAGAIIPEFVKIFTSTKSKHVKEVLNASREGGSSLNILSGFVAGNFSAFWLGVVVVILMGIAYYFSLQGFENIMHDPAIFAFGLVAFGFLGMGPVTIAVDSYGPVTDNAQSIFELSTIETLPNVKEEIKKEFGFEPDFESKIYLEENDGAGNTFKATAKPVLIGTAVVGATTLIFSIIQVLRVKFGAVETLAGLSILNPGFLIGLIIGGAVIYWFSGASNQAVTTGAYRATEFIKKNIKLDGVTKASVEDSKKVVEICTQYAQSGMFNIFLAVFFSTLAYACLDHYLFIGYLISIAVFGLYQAIFMANAGGAWDNAKKLVETELNMKGTELHDATVVGDTVGDPFKDTASVSMNPVIKFTTLFGLLAVELAIELPMKTRIIAFSIFFVISLVFIWRSFYRMRIKQD